MPPERPNITPEELAAVLAQSGPKPLPYWPSIPDPGPVPVYADRIQIERETGQVDPRGTDAVAYRRQARPALWARMALLEAVDAPARAAWLEANPRPKHHGGGLESIRLRWERRKKAEEAAKKRGELPPEEFPEEA